MSGLIKNSPGPHPLVLQTALFKNNSFFQMRLEELNKFIRGSKKQLYLAKIQECIQEKIPTVATALWLKIKDSDDEILDSDLQEFNKKINAPNLNLFLRSAFGDPEEEYLTMRWELCEKLFFFINTNTSEEYIIDDLQRDFNQLGNFKYSDFLGAALLITNPVYAQEDILNHLDTFFNSEYLDYIVNYYARIERSEPIPSTYRLDIIERYEYFSEGIKKWSFVDKYVQSDVKERIREIAINCKDLNNYFSDKSQDFLDSALKDLTTYVTQSFNLWGHSNLNYKFAINGLSNKD